MAIQITGVGSFIPQNEITNEDFAKRQFLDEDGSALPQANDVVIGKFRDITGISARKYADDNTLSSDMAFLASQKAIANAGIDTETIDYIILAHNFGDVKKGAIQSDILPSLASRVKHKLGIRNPRCVAYDILFGCPGWVEGVIQAYAFIKAGMAQKCLVIGTETLSRVVDVHDRDSMIYSDGAGATVIALTSDENAGILAHDSATFAYEESAYLFFGNSYNKDLDPNVRYIKMFGRKIYEFALSQVPKAMKECVDKSGIAIDDIKKVLIHQANEKMDEAIVQRFYKLYGKVPPEGIMPMSIHKLGNSSVATVPTLFDLLTSGRLPGQQLHKGDVIIFASVGAGMNVNAIVYRY
ncbi:3-oxoacyl-ACP synthase [Flavobacterium magnum]|uniref:3-oxoacyl-ACP synthase n=1 Tax=Flavobacterium magnum TaxID=2162713 RepID=A0A2S0RDW3_9FLAO|nr:ketoacyl-ACP synthase III [Flavobacterium magnum]AWA29719.1 3-oxoacyl-ACP synthase [Flavobacterium magnum]